MTAEQIAGALHAPEANVAAHWPEIQAALASVGIASRLAHIAALATIRVECPPFAPRAEQYNGDPHVYFARYDGRKDLGNTEAGDGFRFRGRGYVQITGRYNYAHFGAKVGRDLVSNPDAALEPAAAAAIFACFFHDRHIADAAEREDWTAVRKLVNGGANGLADFLGYVERLKTIF